MRCGVGIFAKTLGLTPVKTRLAETIGQRNANAFYTLSVACVEAFVCEAGEAFPETLAPVWAVAEEEGPEKWKDTHFPAIWTGDGGLGARLANVSDTLFESCDMAILIGTDSPQLSSAHIIQAMSLLMGTPDECVAGPALDGGFYLFGSSQPIARDVWESVTYSSNTTLRELCEAIEAQGRTVKFLSEQQDVDTVDDLRTLHADLAARHDLNHAQKELFSWLGENQHLF